MNMEINIDGMELLTIMVIGTIITIILKISV